MHGVQLTAVGDASGVTEPSPHRRRVVIAVSGTRSGRINAFPAPQLYGLSDRRRFLGVRQTLNIAGSLPSEYIPARHLIIKMPLEAATVKPWVHFQIVR